MDGEDFKDTSGITSTDPTNGNSVHKSERFLHLGKCDGENGGIDLQQTFKEENLVSLFTFDCPPATASVPYRLLHRLDLDFSYPCDTEEEDFFSVMKETNKSKNINICQLFSGYSLRDNINILRLLLESRYAIPICNLEIVELLRITQRIEDDVFLGEDLKLPRIALISQVKNFDSHTGKIMEGLFNLRTSFNTGDASNIEIGQGLVCLGNKKKEACIVIHIWGNFEQYWTSLTDFVDYLIVEDEYKSESDLVDYELVGNEMSSQFSKLSPFIRKYSGETSLPKFITVWIPNLSNMKNISSVRPFCLIEGSLTYFVEIQQSRQLLSIFRETTYHETPLHSLFSSNGYLRMEMDILREMYLRVSQMNGLEEYRTKILLLQKSYAKEGAFLEQLNEVKSIGENNERNDIQRKIIEEHEFRFSRRSKTDPLIMYFLEGLRKNNIDEMVLHLQVLDDAIANNIKKSKIVAQLAEEVRDKTTKFSQRLQLSVTDSEYVKQVELSRKELTVAKENRNNAVLSLRHLWREISLFYSSGNSGEFEDLPQRAAFYLIGGETLELYDGDANMLNVEWIAAIFKNLESLLPQKQIFVLSVLGEQSSGKSTLLNTMFGIRLPASVGQCTRGLTITLVETIERQEYDYVLIFDSEGLRSPEHKGLCGSIKRDNKIATLSVLPSDATILVIKGENDNALKDILPIVALAYKGSKLAEEREGILSCKFFAAYNQVKADGENQKKLENTFSQLSTTLVESFTKTNSLRDLDVHTSIKFPQLLTNEHDIWVFGCNSKGDSPLDVPNTDFSQKMVEFREYIQKQVVSQSGWNAREFGNLEQYLSLVWVCLNNSDFDLSFETVIERHAYTELENKYQNFRKKYYEEYEEQFNLLKNKYKEDYSLQEG
ncbi:interferon-induced very large GTPase 1-like [Artemia franciscana]|uniref:VLIG-type G domain-containing protein n=1 Tax=Artemia franciscana TaxID=6661 RepID=A0AA88L3D4_ARTSF|nr:hypothetical protein QYM36_016401 [Artemia franciscana]